RHVLERLRVAPKKTLSRANLLELPDEDERLDRVPLRVVPGKGPTVREPMVCLKPVPEEKPCGFRAALVAAHPPCLHRFADCRDTRRGFEFRRDVEELALSVVPLLALRLRHQRTSTSMAFVVSLPRMSMTLTRTVYFPVSA